MFVSVGTFAFLGCVSAAMAGIFLVIESDDVRHRAMAFLAVLLACGCLYTMLSLVEQRNAYRGELTECQQQK